MSSFLGCQLHDMRRKAMKRILINNGHFCCLRVNYSHSDCSFALELCAFGSKNDKQKNRNKKWLKKCRSKFRGPRNTALIDVQRSWTKCMWPVCHSKATYFEQIERFSESVDARGGWWHRPQIKVWLPLAASLLIQFEICTEQNFIFIFFHYHNTLPTRWRRKFI